MKKFVAGLVLALCAFIAPAAPLDVNVLRFIEHKEGVLMLTDNTEHCKNGLQMAAIRTNKNEVFLGCYFEQGDTIWIRWDDEDRFGYPVKLFKNTPAT